VQSSNENKDLFFDWNGSRSIAVKRMGLCDKCAGFGKQKGKREKVSARKWGLREAER